MGREDRAMSPASRVIAEQCQFAATAAQEGSKFGDDHTLFVIIGAGKQGCKGGTLGRCL